MMMLSTAALSLDQGRGGVRRAHVTHPAGLGGGRGLGGGGLVLHSAALGRVVHALLLLLVEHAPGQLLHGRILRGDLGLGDDLAALVPQQGDLVHADL